MDAQHFRKSGYVIADADDMAPLKVLRKAIVDRMLEQFSEPAGDEEALLNDFHKRSLAGGALNEFRVDLIKGFNAKIDTGRLVFDAFHETLRALVGSDVAVQKAANLVIQQPHDENVPPSHRDSPPHSLFETVVWVPMVNCWDTKGMSVLNLEDSKVAVDRLKAGDAEGFDKACRTLGKPVEIRFGQALVFWGGLVHHIPVNVESETRWAVNIRYKNAFTPYGAKGIPDYFRILEMSPLADLAIIAESARRSGN